MNVRELYDSYTMSRQKEKEDSAVMAVKIRTLWTEAKQLQEKAQDNLRAADKIAKKMSRIQSVNWIDSVVKPLGEALRKATGKKFCTVYGPFGLCARVSIYLHDESTDDKDLIHQATLDLNLQPCFEDGNSFSLLYETGEITRQCEPGSLADLNGMNRATAPLPDSIDDVVTLMVPVGHITD